MSQSLSSVLPLLYTAVQCIWLTGQERYVGGGGSDKIKVGARSNLRERRQWRGAQVLSLGTRISGSVAQR